MIRFCRDSYFHWREMDSAVWHLQLLRSMYARDSESELYTVQLLLCTVHGPTAVKMLSCSLSTLHQRPIIICKLKVIIKSAQTTWIIPFWVVLWPFAQDTGTNECEVGSFYFILTELVKVIKIIKIVICVLLWIHYSV